MRTEKLVGLVGVLTVTLLAVSLTFLVYEWYLVNGLSVTVFVFPITRVEVNPLGVVFFEQPLCVTNTATKLLLDALFLIPYTVSILITGPIWILASPFRGTPGYEKFRDTLSFWAAAAKGTREQRISIIGGVLIIVAFYLVAVLPFVADSMRGPFLSTFDILLLCFINGILGLTLGGMQLQRAYKKTQKKKTQKKN
ncbi:MAG: hypothetical protein ACTSP1_08355 [Candidatus Freyarchaeota archaeon]